jgi:GntR family transcriptional repressor for pyruvate dehydrogenase complex
MEQLQPVRPVTVFQAVFEQLSGLLAGDTFAPGDRLPAERELAEQLHVSRPSVREALKALHVLGLVEVRGRSTYVKAPPPAQLGDVPSLALPVAEVELLEIHEFREAIESQIAALAAERAAAHDAEALEEVLWVMEEAFSHDSEAFFAADRQFRQALAHAAGNRLLLAAHAQIREHELRQPRLQPAALHSAAVKGALEHTVEARRQILAAVRERDGTRARRLMRAHLAHMRQSILVGAFAHERAADPAEE